MQIEIETKDFIQLQPCLSKLLQTAVSRRYSASRNNLDLSDFHSDTGIVIISLKIYCMYPTVIFIIISYFISILIKRGF
jgi:hypothetical protein